MCYRVRKLRLSDGPLPAIPRTHLSELKRRIGEHMKNKNFLSDCIHINTEDNRFQRVLTLKQNHEKRKRYGEFLVEGISSLKQALKNGWKMRVMLFSSSAGLSDWAEHAIQQSRANERWDLSQDLMAKLSDKEDTSELMAIVKMPERDASAIPIRKDGLVVVLDRPMNPGNLGSTIRSCDAFGVHGIFVTGHATDIYDPQTLRSSVGTLFSIPIVKLESHKNIMEWISQAADEGVKYTIVGTSAKGTNTLVEHKFRGPLVMIFGNETFGMSQSYKSICDTIIRIPISGTASSINLSCAASIALYEISRQRHQA